MERIGIYGGTFNPPHIGHILAASQAIETLKLDRLLLIPDRIAPHKELPGNSATPEQRLEMLRIAAAEQERMIPSRIELDREGPSYTVETVRQLHRDYPQAELYLLMGSDMFLCFHKWYRWREIFERCTLCVASRQTADDLKALRGYAFSQLRVYVKDRAGEHLRFLAAEPLEISSTALRAALAAGADTSRYLPAGVERYIREKGLYGYKAQR